MADTETTPSDSSAADLLPEATRRLIRTADELDETAYAGPSLLPGWSRAHVLAHLALNAEGLAGALAGIVEGRAVPMYASQEARDGDIEDLAAQEPAAIRTRLLGASTDLTDAMAAIPPDAWQTTIERVPGGPVFPASAVADMRLREVEIHHVDLAAAYDRADWPAAFAARLVDGALARRRAAQDGEPGFSVHATDVDRSWDDDGTGPTVAGTAADLGWWLTGRGRGEGLTCEGGDLPRIGAW